MSTNDGSAPVILFDGVCNLCHAAVRFIVRHDSEERFRFASLASDTGRALLEAAGADPDGPAGDPDSVVLIEHGRAYVKSEAALRIAARLPAPWRWLAPLRLLPRGVRDATYDVVARHRYRWFGRKDSCPAPSPELRDRLLD